MNDRFKYRFWHKPTKKMVNCYGFNRDFVFGDVLDGIGTVYNPAKFEDCILMQSTGLKDKNGKLIYEADIVKTSKGIANVEYDNTYAYFGLTNFLTVFSFDNFINEEIEVIGNIYENPELIKE